MNSHSDSESYC